MKKTHWTQTPEGKARMSEIQKLAHSKVREAKVKRTYTKKQKKESTTLVINGWRVTLGKGEIRIDN